MIPYHLHIQAGSTYERSFIYTDDQNLQVDLAGYTAKMQIRPTAASSTLTLDLTPTIDNATGEVFLVLTPSQTATLVSGFVYALELSNGVKTFRLSEGQLVVSPEVVR